MKTKLLHTLSILIVCTNYTFCQNAECDTIYSIDLDKQPAYGNSSTDLLRLFNDELLEIILDNFTDVFPPTSFKMILIINKQDEVESISSIRGNYSEKTKEAILRKLKDVAEYETYKNRAVDELSEVEKQFISSIENANKQIKSINTKKK